MIKTTIGLISLLLYGLWFAGSTTSGQFFYDKFFCHINQEAITVALSGSQSCFELLDDINQHREKLVLNIAQITQQYITPTHPDKAYWLMVRAQLYQQYQKRTKLIHHIYRHMENFEQGLFIKIKKLTLDRLANAQSRINQQRELLNKSAPTGGISGRVQHRDAIIQLGYQRDLLTSVSQAQRFSEFFPSLTRYLRIVEDQNPEFNGNSRIQSLQMIELQK